MPKVDAIAQLLNTIADRALMPFSRIIQFPKACRQFPGPTVSMPFKEINQFRPEAGDVADIVPSANLPTVDKAKGQNITMPMDNFKGISFTLDDKDYTDLTGLGSMVAPAVLTETAEKLAQYINLNIFNNAVTKSGFDWQRTAGTPFDTDANFGSQLLAGSYTKLLKNHAPSSQTFIASPEAYGNLLKLNRLSFADQRGSAATAMSGNIGTYAGIEFLPQPGILQRNNTGWTSSVKPLVDRSAAYAVGATTMHVDTKAPVVGNMFVHSNTVHTITSVANKSGQDIDITFYPGLTATIANNTALTQYTPTPSLHFVNGAISFASGIISPASFRNMRGNVRQAVRREPRSGVYLMLNHFDGYFQELYVMSAYWGSIVDRPEGVIGVG